MPLPKAVNGLKRFNRIKDLSKKEEDSEDLNPVQIEIPSSSTKVGI